MKVLLINKFYYVQSGVERVLFETKELLEKAGHEVVVFSMDNPKNEKSKQQKYFVPYVDFSNLKKTFSKTARFFYYRKAARNLALLIKKEKPDIAHLHNVYHQLTYSVLKPLKKYKIPTVLTLHDYHLISPNYNLFHKGKVCEVVKKHSYYKAIFHRCVDNSFLKSIAGAISSYWHWLYRVEEKVDLFISPSNFLKNKYKEFGFKGKFEVVNNVVDLKDFEPSYPAGDYITFVGRLSEEKGLINLLKVMVHLPEINLKIAGDGPQEKELKKFVIVHGLKNVEFLGYLEKAELQNVVKRSAFVVVPSIWYENYPMTAVEAMALGKPVVASDLGGLTEIVTDGQTGLLLFPGNQKVWQSAIKKLFSDKKLLEKMGKQARLFVQENNSSEQYYEKIIAVYQRLINKKIDLG
ncbi:glycosyltransferase family 4 protein [Candidatus Falkowbacteria bacterium]|nr:glycosyltransferase family 4 protein [Candidatus Falkowbacteria bacterium]